MANKKILVQQFERVEGSEIPICHVGETIDKPVYTEKDKRGNKFEIFCTDGHFEGKFTPKGGKPVFVGKCKYGRGHNWISKKLLSLVTMGWKVNLETGIIEYSVVNVEELEIQKILWKSVEPVGPPPTTGTQPYGAEGDGVDTLWIFDPAKNEIIIQKTKHTGHWILNPPGSDLTKGQQLGLVRTKTRSRWRLRKEASA